MWATRVCKPGEGYIGSGIEVEVGGKAVLGGDIDIGSRLIGMVEAVLPLLRMPKIAGGDAQDGEEELRGVVLDDAAGNGFGQLGDRGLDRVHGLERRQVEFEALAAGTGLGHAKATGAITKMIDAVALSSDGK